MKFFLDNNKKRIFIVPPKCGNTSISKYLNVPLHSVFPNIDKLLIDETFVKIIIIRHNVIDRFLSGFYEDLFNNICYENVDISFTNYLNFLNHCFINKIKNVNNLNVQNGNKDQYICFGNCSNVSLPITNNKGIFVSHIQPQYITWNHPFLKSKNIELLKIENINDFLNINIRENIKNKKTYNINLDELKLSDMKKNKIIINSDCLKDKHINIILNI